jgi:predicted amidohydrolase YtcJ
MRRHVRDGRAVDAGDHARATRGRRADRGRHGLRAARDRRRARRSLHRELELLVAAGLPPAAALRAATIVPATMMGRADRIGAVAAGQAADLVLLRADPLADVANTRAIEGVVLRGAWLPRARLDEAMARVQALRES